MEPSLVRLTIPDSVDMTALMGPADSLLRRIEAMTDATITVRGNQVSVMGEPVEANRVISIFSQLIQMVSLGETPSPDEVDLLLTRSRTFGETESSFADDILLTYRGRALRPKTAGQRRYIDAVRRNTLTFALGPAGTGKTYLAMAMAVAALKRREVGRIVLCRPVVEAGESLGYLPGTLQEKLDPYVRPLYDALFDMTDMEKGNALIEQGVIEIAPLAYMRGRTLNDAFVILDEAQNTTPRSGVHARSRHPGLPGRRRRRSDRSVALRLRIQGRRRGRARHRRAGAPRPRRLGARLAGRHALVARIVEAYEAAEARSSRIQGGLA